MEDFPKNQENVGEDNNSGAEILSEMPPFEEHKASVERRAELGEKYYQQAEAERDSWVADTLGKIEEAKNQKPEDMIFVTNHEEYFKSGHKRGYRQLDPNNERDMAKLNDKINADVEWLNSCLEDDKNADLDELVQCFKNDEMIDQIGKKLAAGEEFSTDEREFLSRNNPNNGYFLTDYYKTSHDYRAMCHDGHIMVAGYSYNDLLSDEEYRNSPYRVVAQAQMRELVKEDRALLHKDEKVQGALENMEERRAENPFAGETNINSETGEARTFTLEDNYPRLENESEEDYAKRLKRINLKTRLAEKQQ